MPRWVLSMAVCAALVALACSPGQEKVETAETPVARPPDSERGALRVYTVNYPLQYFAERIGGELVEAVFPAPPEVDPAYWAPAPEVIVDYQGADLILLNGAGYAKWLERATLPAAKLIDTSAGFRDRLIPLQEGPVHTHGLEGEHSHKGYAFTTWLDPQRAAGQARAVAAAFEKARPESASLFQERLASLEADLEALDVRLETVARAIGDQPLLASHPAYQYLVDRYGLDLSSVHWEPDEVPTEAQWRELEGILTSHPARWMIWEGEPTTATAERLSELGVQSLVFEPCGNRPSQGDLMTVMERNAASLERVGGG